MQKGKFPKIEVDDIESADDIQPANEIEHIQASTSGTHTNEMIFGPDDVLLSKLLAAKEDRKNGRKKAGSEKIQSTPEIMLRNEDFKEYYKPMELSIGPLHAGDPKLFNAELKLRLAEKFIGDSGESAKKLLQNIRDNIERLSMFFDKQVIASYNDESLTRLLFLDGCVVLQFIHSFVSQSLNEFEINSVQAALIQQDLFLLENQIPFAVLQILSWKYENADLIIEFVLKSSIMAPLDSVHLLVPQDSKRVAKCFKSKEFLHLLNLLREIILIHHVDDHNDDNKDKNHTNGSCFHYTPVASIFCRLPVYFSSFFRLCPSQDHWQPQQSFRNVQELKAAGITLKPSDSCSLRAVSFHKRSFFRGQLKLPPLVVDDSTKRKLLNLVAYEMCNPKYEQNCEVTSYVNFLDLLIDSEEDVKDLRAADILRNRMSSDIEVAKLFNSIGSTCFMHSSDTYQQVKNDIENHYKRKIVVWMAQVYRTHFSSPWSIIALIATGAILSLTTIQAYYAIHPKN